MGRAASRISRHESEDKGRDPMDGSPEDRLVRGQRGAAATTPAATAAAVVASSKLDAIRESETNDDDDDENGDLTVGFQWSKRCRSSPLASKWWPPLASASPVPSSSPSLSLHSSCACCEAAATTRKRTCCQVRYSPTVVPNDGGDDNVDVTLDSNILSSPSQPAPITRSDSSDFIRLNVNRYEPEVPGAQVQQKRPRRHKPFATATTTATSTAAAAATTTTGSSNLVLASDETTNEPDNNKPAAKFTALINQVESGGSDTTRCWSSSTRAEGAGSGRHFANAGHSGERQWRDLAAIDGGKERRLSQCQRQPLTCAACVGGHATPVLASQAIASDAGSLVAARCRWPGLKDQSVAPTIGIVPPIDRQAQYYLTNTSTNLGATAAVGVEKQQQQEQKPAFCGTQDHLSTNSYQQQDSVTYNNNDIINITEKPPKLPPDFFADKSTTTETAAVAAAASEQASAASNESAASATEWNRMDWKGIENRYGKMPRQHSQGQFWWRLRQSCCCNVLLTALNGLFPILSSFRNYSLPGDLFTDLMAGFTIAVLHIPQGMAYGLLAGVEPIYGLYVSFVPVLIMALMSRSLHVSYGTFAVISMLLASAIDSAKLILKQQVTNVGGGAANLKSLASEPLVGGELGGLVLTNNHQAAGDTTQQMFRNLLVNALSDEASSSPLVSSTGGSEASSGSDSLSGPSAALIAAAAATPSIWPFSAAQFDSSVFEMPTNIEILTCICFIVGLIQLTMAMMRLGILSLMFSDQLVSSFTTASAIHVVTSQLAPALDLSLPPVPDGLFKVCRTWWMFVAELLDGFNWYTAFLTIASLLFLLAIKELVEPALRRKFKSLTCLPSELVLMGFLIFGSWYWQFESNYDIRIIGPVPTGLPAPRLPRFDLASVVFQDSLTIALVSFAMNLSLAQVYAKRFRYTMDPNQELFALGSSNLASSFFCCFPCASSLSRSAVQSNMNVKSPLCSLFSCALVVSIICYFAPLLHDLPRSTLSCIIIVALKGILVQVKDLYENWRLSKLDAFVWMITFMSVIAFGVTYGLVLGIVTSLFMIFFRLLTPNHSILGQLPGTEIYVDKNAFIECNEIEQVKIFRFNSPLCYLNRTMFKARVEKSLPSIYKQQGFALFSNSLPNVRQLDNEKIKCLVIDCSALAYCDYSGAATLVELIEELEEHKVDVYLAACPIKLINMIEKMQKTNVLERNVYPTITDAIKYARYLRTRNTLAQMNLFDENASGSCA